MQYESLKVLDVFFPCPVYSQHQLFAYEYLNIAYIIGHSGLEFLFNPFRTAVPFWGPFTQTLCSLYPKRVCGSKGVNLSL